MRDESGRAEDRPSPSGSWREAGVIEGGEGLRQDARWGREDQRTGLLKRAEAPGERASELEGRGSLERMYLALEPLPAARDSRFRECVFPRVLDNSVAKTSPSRHPRGSTVS